MHGLAKLSVESEAAKLGFADSPRKPEDSLSQRLVISSRYRALIALFIASCFALCAPLYASQAAAQAEPSSPTPAVNAQATPSDATTPVQLPPAEAATGSSEEQLRLALQQGKADI